MNRVSVIHWKPQQAGPLLERLERAGYRVELLTPDRAAGLKRLAARPPAAIVIDLTRLPSQGRDVALWLQGRKMTRAIPLVFPGGSPDKVEALRRVLPDAVHTDVRRTRRRSS